MTKEIRHVINKHRFAWSLDDLVLPVLELWFLYYVGSLGYAKLMEITSFMDTIDGVVYFTVSVLGILLAIRRLLQLNTFTVLETPLDQEENFIFCLDRVKMFNIDKREFDKHNYCVGVRAHSSVNPFSFWLTMICYENKIYINERPAFVLLSLWWTRTGANRMVEEVKKLQEEGKELADREVERIQRVFAEHAEARARGDETLSIDPWEKHIVEDPSAPAYYTPSTINWFSYLFTPLAGTFLLVANVQKKNKWKVLGLGILCSTVGFYVIHVLPTSMMVIMYVNIGVGTVLSGGLWNMFISKDLKFRAKSFWLPLIMALAILLPLYWVFYWR